jgi:hypothetical protein
MENQTLASEMLSELKAQNKRLFVALIVVLALWFATIGIFFWYISLPIDETTVEQQLEGDANSMIGIGDTYYGELSASDEAETGETYP